jgi:hypothetical protein
VTNAESKSLEGGFVMNSEKTFLILLSLLLALTFVGCSETINLDTDGDGWSDGNLNILLQLKLKRVEVFHTEDSIGEDELYFLVDGERFPQANTDGPDCHDLCGFWNVKENDNSPLSGGPGCTGTKQDLNCDLTVATRALSYQHANQSGVVPLVHLQVLDDDDDVFPPTPAWPAIGPNKRASDWNQGDDDLLGDMILRLEGSALTDSNPSTGVTITKDVQKGNAFYRLTFQVSDSYFGDPDPKNDSDSDEDGLSESKEAQLSIEFGGISNPRNKDLFVEMDVVSPSGEGIDQATINLVTTQFAIHGIALHVDANGQLAAYPGKSELITGSEAVSTVFFETGGSPTVLDYREGQNGKSKHFDASRKGTFHYVLFVDDLREGALGNFGRADQPGDTLAVQRKLTGMDFLYDYQALTFMHELGHNLSLCHPRDVRAQICTHYSVPNNIATNDLDGATAMGTPAGGELLFKLPNAIVRPVDYFSEEWTALNLKDGLK